MKKSVIISIAAVAMLSTLGAQDSVSAKEADAIKSTVKGEASAKAKVEETRAKDAFEAKEVTGAFNKEAAQDVKKVDAAAKAKELKK